MIIDKRTNDEENIKSNALCGLLINTSLNADEIHSILEKSYNITRDYRIIKATSNLGIDATTIKHLIIELNRTYILPHYKNPPPPPPKPPSDHPHTHNDP